MTIGSTMRLEDACDVEYGTRVVQRHDGGDNYPVYGGGGATFKMDTFNREDRLVVSRFGMSPECTRFVEGRFFLNDSGLTVSPRGPALLQRYLDYQLVSLNDTIFALGKGSAQKNLDVPAFRSLQVFVPSDIKDQRRIVGILDEAFESIATAKTNAEKNLQNARALFESNLQSVFSKQGEGVEAKPLGEVCDLLGGFAFRSGDAVPESDTQLVRMGNLYGNRLDLDRSPAFYPDRFATEYRRYLLQEGDLVMSLTGTTGKEDYGYAVKIPSCGRNLLLNQRIAKFDAIKRELVNQDYLLYYLRSRAFLDILYPTANGTRQANLSSATIKTLPIPLCPLLDQKRIATSLQSLTAETDRLASIYQQKLAALDELKKSLLHQAFSGEL